MSTDVSEVCAVSIIIALMMEAARTCETSVDIQLKTRQYIPEDSELYTRRRENLESHCTVTTQSVSEAFNTKSIPVYTGTSHWPKSSPCL
jgi:hypothetical protein